MSSLFTLHELQVVLLHMRDRVRDLCVVVTDGTTISSSMGTYRLRLPPFLSVASLPFFDIPKALYASPSCPPSLLLPAYLGQKSSETFNCMHGNYG